ncbi:MAG: LysR family transcriptional regulator [Planctomycetes bacterium]|nr:LysR family transcriptional regulator [Planctomycetota bacterium]
MITGELNYHHLHYFWSVVRVGGVNAAARDLMVSASTVSEQIRMLEVSLGARLLRRKGRSIEPTEVGRQVHRYAEEIFSLGREMQLVLQGSRTPSMRFLRVSAEMSVPKLLVRQFLEPVLKKHPEARLVCREGTHEEVQAELAGHQSELVLTDRPFGAALDTRVFHHSLGRTGICLMADEATTRKLRRKKRDLSGVPMLFSAAGTALRAATDDWMARTGVKPHVVGEFDDTALMKEFSANGAGLVALPMAVEQASRKQFGLRRLLVLEGASVEFYAVTLNRRITDVVVETVISAARQHLK